MLIEITFEKSFLFNFEISEYREINHVMDIIKSTWFTIVIIIREIFLYTI